MESAPKAMERQPRRRTQITESTVWDKLNKELSRPFEPAAVKFRMQGKGQAVPYIDARSVISRLNTLVPGLWDDTYAPGVMPGWVECILTVRGVSHADQVEADTPGGMIDVAKTAISEALKRAAVKFGVGLSIYALPKFYVPREKEPLYTRANPNGKGTFLTREGEAYFRDAYGRWLNTPAGKSWGAPMAHGDDPESAGETEPVVDAAPAVAAPAAVQPPALPPTPRPGDQPVEGRAEDIPPQRPDDTPAEVVIEPLKYRPKDRCPECARLEKLHGRPLDSPGVLWPNRKDAAFLQCSGRDREFGNAKGYCNHMFPASPSDNSDEYAF